MRSLNHTCLHSSLRKSPWLPSVLSILFFAVAGLGISAFGSTALAQDSKWELQIGGGYVGAIDDEWVHNSYDTHVDSGFGFMVSAGYRFKDWFSLNLEQSLNQTYSNGSIDHYNIDHGMDEAYDYYLFGETAITVKFLYINSSKDFEFYGKIGAGMYYGKSYNNIKRRGVSYDERIDDHFFAYLPIGIGMNYYFNDHLGIGLDAQYDFTVLDSLGFIKTTLHLAWRF